MGNREDLLAGAKRCLSEKGYARTTARDIATAAGVSLAAIGYHFGSKEALLNTALHQAMQEWGEGIEQALNADTDPGATPAQRFETIWDRVIASFATHRPIWVTQFELIAQMDRLPELREQLAASMNAARLGLAEMFQNAGVKAEGENEEKARAIGSLYHVMLGGVLVQWLVDPEQTPSGRDMAEALRIIAGSIGTDPAGEG